MRTTVDLEPALLEQLRLEAVRRGTTVKALLNAVIRAGLTARVAEPAAVYRVEAVAMGAPRLDLTKALAIAAALEDEDHLRDMHRRK
jgi:hypothetical protein